MQALIDKMKLQVQNVTMEKPENKKRRSRERPDHEKKKRKKKIKTNENKLIFGRSDIYELDKNDRRKDRNDLNYHHRLHHDRSHDDENLDHFALSSSSDVIGELGIFDFPWLKDEDCMFITDDVDQLCRSSLEDMASEQQMSFSLYFDHLHNHNTEAWIEINQDSDKQEYYVDSKSDCTSSDFDQENELGRMEYYIWTSVLNQPLN